jgi:hypothetical protein
VRHVWGEEKCAEGFFGEDLKLRPLGRPRLRWENFKMNFK